jgi:hypothetical protein
MAGSMVLGDGESNSVMPDGVSYLMQSAVVAGAVRLCGSIRYPEAA